MEATEKVIRISVVIPTFQGRHKIGTVLNSLIHQTRRPDEVIVVIDGSTDETASYLKGLEFPYPLFIINQENKGRAGARNSGVKLAKGELLFFADDDIQLDEDCIGTHERFHLAVSKSIATGNLIDSFDEVKSDFQVYKASLSKKWLSELSDEKPLGSSSLFLSAANFSIRRTDFLKLGGFDKRLKDAEDFDLAIRAHEAGYSIRYISSAIGYHHDPVSVVGYIRRLRQYRAAHLQLKDLNPVASTYFNYKVYEINRVSMKRLIYWIFSSKITLYLIEKDLLTFLPKAIRFKIYDFVTTSWYLYFPNKPLV